MSNNVKVRVRQREQKKPAQCVDLKHYVDFHTSTLHTIVVTYGAFDKLPWVDPERSHSPSRGDGMHLRSAPSDPLHKQGTEG